jgi:hypothetical protein
VYAEAAVQLLGATSVDASYWMVNDAEDFDHRGYEWTPERRQRFLDVVSGMVDGIEAGVFPTVPGEWDSFRGTHANCKYCAFDGVCDRDRGERAEAKLAAPELRRRDVLTWSPADE